MNLRHLGRQPQVIRLTVSFLLQPVEVVKLAKRKVEDLEEVETPSATAAASCSPEDVAKGTNLLRDFLTDWSNKTAEEEDEVDMASASAVESASERQAKRLKICVRPTPNTGPFVQV